MGEGIHEQCAGQDGAGPDVRRPRHGRGRHGHLRQPAALGLDQGRAAPKEVRRLHQLPRHGHAAHNCTMKAVAVLGAYPAYELKEADLTCSNLEELSIYNVRRLFAMDGDNFMVLKKEQEASAAPMKESPAGVSDY